MVGMIVIIFTYKPTASENVACYKSDQKLLEKLYENVILNLSQTLDCNQTFCTLSCKVLYKADSFNAQFIPNSLFQGLDHSSYF